MDCNGKVNMQEHMGNINREIKILFLFGASQNQLNCDHDVLVSHKP